MRQTREGKNSRTGGFIRLSEVEAREIFDRGHTVSVTHDGSRPGKDGTPEVDYTRGEELFFCSPGIACDFGQVIQDFNLWLNSSDSGGSSNRKLSYWTRQEACQ